MPSNVSAPRELPIGFKLSHGWHPTPEYGMNLLESLAYVAGEQHGLNRPACACPVLAAVGGHLNVQWDAAEIQLFVPLIPRLVRSHSTLQVARHRRYVLIDAAIRELAPIGLEAVKWIDLANWLKGLAPIVDIDTAAAAYRVSCKVRDEALKRETFPGADAYAGWQVSAVRQAVGSFSMPCVLHTIRSDDSSPSNEATAAAKAAYDTIHRAEGIADAASGIGGGDWNAPQEERARRLNETRRPVIEVTMRAYERALAIAD